MIGMDRLNILCINYRVQNNSMPKLNEGTGGDQNKDFLSRNYVSEKRPHSSMGGS